MLVVSGLLGVAALVRAPLVDAVEVREELDRRHGPRETYTPPPVGVIPDVRIRTFLSVRRAVHTACSRFADARGSLAQFERRVDGGDGQARGVVDRGLDTLRGALGFGSATVDFFGLRNRALLDAGMGLGEYVYLYAVAYADRLVVTTEFADGSSETHLGANREQRRILRGMLRRQLEAARSEPLPGDWTARLADEVARLDDDEQAVPWSRGLPPTIRDSLALHRAALDSLFCPHTLDLEMTRIEVVAGGIGVRGDQ